MTPARPRPVTRPRRAHMSWTEVINGNENRAVHSGADANAAPATEYVEMPDGSSSAAPVMSPGPRPAKKRWKVRVSWDGLFVFGCCCFLEGCFILSG